MDEDAIASSDWLARLSEGYADRDVLGVGGAIEPIWLSGRPHWFPQEFGWVVGCTYRGMPEMAAPVARRLGSSRRLICIEANHFLLDYIRQNVQSNAPKTNLTVVDGALDYAAGGRTHVTLAIGSDNTESKADTSCIGQIDVAHRPPGD